VAVGGLTQGADGLSQENEQTNGLALDGERSESGVTSMGLD